MTVDFGEEAEVVLGLLSRGDLLRDGSHRRSLNTGLSTVSVSVLLRLDHWVVASAYLDRAFTGKLILNDFFIEIVEL